MKGIEKGQKKETDSLFVVGSKKNNRLMGISLPYFRWRSNPSTTCLTRSQVEVAFVIFTFHNLLFIIYFSFLRI